MSRLLLLSSLCFGLTCLADDVLSRAHAAQKRGPVVLAPTDGGSDCFVPTRLDGARCGAGLKLCRNELSDGMCDGYARQTVSLSVEYEGEPGRTTVGVNGYRPGFPVSHEEAPSLEMESYHCARGLGLSAIATSGSLTPQERAALEEKNRVHQENQLREAREAQEACLAKSKAMIEKARRWHRCELLAVDACRREAFLECKGNHGPRGLVRATWSRPADRPANETLVVTPLGR